MTKLDFKQITDSNLLLYRYVRGSHAYGIATETSDMDEGGVYMCPLYQLNGLGFDYQDQVSDAKADKVWLELNKFMRLLVKSNPTVLESLFIPENYILYEHPIMSRIKEHRDEFISKECFDSFYGYGVSQIKKCRGLNKKINNPVTERLWPLDFCYTFYGQGSSKIRNWLEYRGLDQKYCGLVNIPNMHDVYGCYYDWGRFFSDNGITHDDIIMYRNYVPARKITDIVNEWKSLDKND
ncbi:MAG: nucleotidyltransferase domain-containing protein, partial [Prevotella sp.]|nr:nucleotidyltransferase domain-containing protein [Prevotella sp.]